MDFVAEAYRQNPHWESARVSFPRVTGPLIDRPVFSDLQASWRRKFMTVLRGLRRTGKSVLARQLLQGMVEKHGKKVAAWFEFDRAMNVTAHDLDALIRFFQGQGAQTIFLDEVVVVASWQDVLKRYYDRTDLKFVATGSAALELDQRTSESLAGRFELIHVTPFTLAETLELKKKKPPVSRIEFAQRQEELEAESDSYMRIGGLPEIVNEKDTNKRVAYVRNSLLSPLLYKDLQAASELKASPDHLQKALEVLAATVSFTYQLQTIAQVLGCAHPTAGTVVTLLERGLLIRTAYNYTPSLVKQRRTSKKIVFADNSIIAALRSDVPVGVLAENAAANALNAEYFWRDAEGREVDFIFQDKKLAAEVKYQEHVTTADEKHLSFLLQHKKGYRGVLITKNESDTKADIPRIPLWRVLLERLRTLEAVGITFK